MKETSHRLPEDVRPASAILLHRGGKIWLGRRGRVRFLPGFSVFPGGACEHGESFEQAAQRELAEETGLSCEQNALQPFARAITPPYSRYRFDVRVYSLELGEHLEPKPDGGELIEGIWGTPDTLLEMRDRGELQLAPPTWRQILQWKAAEGRLVDDAFAAPPVRNERVLPMSPALCLVPLRTSALPPAEWTNTVLMGSADYFLVDPGGKEQAALQAEMSRRSARGHRLKGVILTHHHNDHLEGYHNLKVSHLPLYCHPLTAELLPSDFPVPTMVGEGDRFEWGEDVAECIFTPGHAPGHLALYLPRERSLLAGDMISSLSSVIIPADNGDLGHFLASLERLRALDANLIVPSHGPPYGAGSDPFGIALQHRVKRQEQVLAALSSGASTVDEVTSLVYGNLNPVLVPAAHMNVGHYLKKLTTDGRVERIQDGWVLTES